ncbi:hypothetical protein E1301_Tti018185 [Triplophysa tibetana]|uniref:Uncharacterized protein n=1 Tax=Triplophysa tibetana TaxID=1572043 RepID=A0A5A9P1N6_9TELE|nr:hypothetical protein E1301_Tti018185 [Triplophysa tibetana]
MGDESKSLRVSLAPLGGAFVVVAGLVPGLDLHRKGRQRGSPSFLGESPHPLAHDAVYETSMHLLPPSARGPTVRVSVLLLMLVFWSVAPGRLTLRPTLAVDGPGALNLCGIEPLRVSACFLESSNCAWNAHRPSLKSPDGEIGGLRNALRSRSGRAFAHDYEQNEFNEFFFFCRIYDVEQRIVPTCSDLPLGVSAVPELFSWVRHPHRGGQIVIQKVAVTGDCLPTGTSHHFVCCTGCDIGAYGPKVRDIGATASKSACISSVSDMGNSANVNPPAKCSRADRTPIRSSERSPTGGGIPSGSSATHSETMCDVDEMSLAASEGDWHPTLTNPSSIPSGRAQDEAEVMSSVLTRGYVVPEDWHPWGPMPAKAPFHPLTGWVSVLSTFFFLPKHMAKKLVLHQPPFLPRHWLRIGIPSITKQAPPGGWLGRAAFPLRPGYHVDLHLAVNYSVRTFHAFSSKDETIPISTIFLPTGRRWPLQRIPD